MADMRKELLLLDQPPSKPSFLDCLLLTGKGDAAGAEKRTAPANEDLKGRILATPLPPSQVLGKVKDFLGVMGKANEKLELEAQKNGSLTKYYDMEALTGNEKEYIQMDLLLGITDLHSDEAVAAAEAAMTSCNPPLSSHSCSSSDTEEDDSNNFDDKDDDGEEAMYHSQGLSPKDKQPLLKKSKTTKKPKIIVLDQSSN